jgi:hypothetical protein
VGLPPQRRFYAVCFMTLLRKCAVVSPEIADIFRSIAAFVSTGGPEVEETILGLIALVEQNPHVFPFLSPIVFQLLLNPRFLSAVSTLVAVAVGLKPHIPRRCGSFSRRLLNPFQLLHSSLFFISLKYSNRMSV